MFLTARHKPYQSLQKTQKATFPFSKRLQKTYKNRFFNNDSCI